MKINSLKKMTVLAAGLAMTGASCTGSSSSEADAANTSLDPLNPTTQATVAKEQTATTDREQVDTREGGDPLERYAAYLEAYNAAAGPPFTDPETGINYRESAKSGSTYLAS